jgi:hypothetical protein
MIAGIEEADRGILQDIKHAELPKSRTERPYNYLFRCVAGNDETCNAEMLARFHPQPG